MSKCLGCPRAGPCEGEATPRLCELVDPSHPDFNPRYLPKLEPQPQPRGLVSLAPWIRAAAACPHRGPAEGACGCHWCGRDHRRVTPPECWACREAEALQTNHDRGDAP